MWVANVSNGHGCNQDLNNGRRHQNKEGQIQEVVVGRMNRTGELSGWGVSHRENASVLLCLVIIPLRFQQQIPTFPLRVCFYLPS